MTNISHLSGAVAGWCDGFQVQADDEYERYRNPAHCHTETKRPRFYHGIHTEREQFACRIHAESRWRDRSNHDAENWRRLYHPNDKDAGKIAADEIPEAAEAAETHQNAQGPKAAEASQGLQTSKTGQISENDDIQAIKQENGVGRVFHGPRGDGRSRSHVRELRCRGAFQCPGSRRKGCISGTFARSVQTGSS